MSFGTQSLALTSPVLLRQAYVERAQLHTRADAHTDARTCTQTHAHTYIHTHARTHIHHTHKHTHTHKHLASCTRTHFLYKQAPMM